MHVTRYGSRAANLVAAATLSGAVLTGAVLLGTPHAAGAVTPTIPADTSRQGYVGLCDEAGHNVSGGSVHAAPFIWKAVASSRPPASFRGRGQNAVLAIYQVQPELPAADWSGRSLTAATFYRHASTPTAQATYADGSLAAFTRAFPPARGGLYELRMTFGKAGYGLYGATYPASFIQVSGGRWRVVDGGTVHCAAASGTSNEQLTGVAGPKLTTPRKPDVSVETVRPASAPGPYRQAPVATGTSPAGDTSVSSGGTATTTWLSAACGGLLVVLGGGALLRRRRTAGSPPRQSSA